MVWVPTARLAEDLHGSRRNYAANLNLTIQAPRDIWVTKHLRHTERGRRHRPSPSSLRQTLLTGSERG